MGAAISADVRWFSNVAFVRLYHLTNAKRRFHFQSENFDIRVPATGKGTMHPHNVACLDADANLIAHAGTIELVRVPFLIEFGRLVNRAVSTINCDEASLVLCVAAKPVAPLNLSERK